MCRTHLSTSSQRIVTPNMAYPWCSAFLCCLLCSVGFPGSSPSRPGDVKERTLGTRLRTNRPFPSSPVPLFQNEFKCETFLMKISSACSFYFHANQSHFHKNGFELRLALKQRHERTGKWSTAMAHRQPDLLLACSSQLSILIPHFFRSCFRLSLKRFR